MGRLSQFVKVALVLAAGGRKVASRAARRIAAPLLAASAVLYAGQVPAAVVTGSWALTLLEAGPLRGTGPAAFRRQLRRYGQPQLQHHRQPHRHAQPERDHRLPQYRRYRQFEFLHPLGANTLTLDNTFNAANAQINQLSTSKGDTIGVNLGLNSSTNISNASSNTLTLNTGTITASTPVNLNFFANGIGAIAVSNNIGSTGSGIAITNSGSSTGTVTLSGTLGASVSGVTENSAGSALVLSGVNNYTGPTTVTAGTLTLSSALGGGNYAGASTSAAARC